MELSFFRRCSLSAATAFTSLFAAAPAYAHHAMGGRTPATPMEGLISGLVHPVIGVDHFAFVLGVGFATAFLGARLAPILFFVAATLLGCTLQLQGVVLPAAEFVVAGSVLLIGAILMSGTKVPAPVIIAIFGVAGLFHGWAYGESIVGAEQTPVLAYLAGFAIVQLAAATGVMLIIRRIWHAERALRLRLTGGVIAGFGAAFLFENIERVLLPGVS
ncbi:MAG TPA: HupE/UreJ family protein [Dongiaceae bacterium]